MQNLDTLGIITLIVYFIVKEWLSRRRDDRFRDDRVKWKVLIQKLDEDIQRMRFHVEQLDDKMRQIDIRDISQRIEWIYKSHYKTLDKTMERLADAVEAMNKEKK